MREITKTVYTYEELNDTAKERARQKYGMFDDHDAEILTDAFEEELEELGYTDADVRWSLSCCQGDGVSFTGEWSGAELRAICNRVYNGDIPKNINRIIPFIKVEFRRIDSYYAHARTVYTDVDLFNGDRDLSSRFIDAMTELRKSINVDRIEVCGKLEKIGYAQIDWVESAENFAEMCEANEWEFYEDGEMY